MQINSVIHGFRVVNVRQVAELEGKLWQMVHEKTGAQLCWLERPDEN